MQSMLIKFPYFQDGRLTFHPGSQVVKLPFINFMKARGTSFLNAYTNSPICCPSRAGMNILNMNGRKWLHTEAIFTV